MHSASRTILINRPIADVFAFFADAENDLQWRSGVKETKRQGELGRWSEPFRSLSPASDRELALH